MGKLGPVAVWRQAFGKAWDGALVDWLATHLPGRIVLPKDSDPGAGDDLSDAFRTFAHRNEVRGEGVVMQRRRPVLPLGPKAAPRWPAEVGNRGAETDVGRAGLSLAAGRALAAGRGHPPGPFKGSGASDRRPCGHPGDLRHRRGELQTDRA